MLALRLAGRINDQQRVSDTSTDMNDALSLLVMMLGQWQRKRWLVWNEAETAKVATGSQWYSVGPGGDFNMPRPDKLHGGFCRMKPFGGPNPVDIHLSIIESKEDWAKITIKDLKSLPEALFYDSAFPLGRVTFYPVPPANDYELHIFTKAQLPVYVHLTDQLLVPPGISRRHRQQPRPAPAWRADHAAAARPGARVAGDDPDGECAGLGSVAARHPRRARRRRLELERARAQSCVDRWLGGSAVNDGNTGYPWSTGDVLLAADLNAAIANAGAIIAGTYAKVFSADFYGAKGDRRQYSGTLTVAAGIKSEH